MGKRKLSAVSAQEAVSEVEEVQSEKITFSSLGVPEDVCAILERIEWTTPTKIQTKSLPHTLTGRDVIGLAQTGSGKTGAFAIPVVCQLLTKKQRLFALVLAPTRELCIQITDTFNALGRHIDMTTQSIVGGLPMTDQAIQLAKKPHVIVATPGRLADHLENTGGFSISAIRFLILDEADRLLSMDFEDDLYKIVKSAPVDRQTFLFSATMTSQVDKLQRACLRKPVMVKVDDRHSVADALVQWMSLVPPQHKNAYLVALVKRNADKSGIIFCNKCSTALTLHELLVAAGFSSSCLVGHMDQSKRIGALNRFRSRKSKLLVATEVGSRGLDIPNVDIVINFDVPSSPSDYIHRVGRTARMGRMGESYTMVSPFDVDNFLRIERHLGKSHRVSENDSGAVKETGAFRMQKYTGISEEDYAPLTAELAALEKEAKLEANDKEAKFRSKKFKKSR